MAQGVYGIESFKIQNAAANAFPASWTNAFTLRAIVKDSVTFNDSEASTNDIEVEDMKEFYAKLPSSPASKGFTADIYDLSEEAFTYLEGFQKSGEWMEANPSFELPDQAVQIVTKEFSEFPSKTFEWAKMKVKVTKAGTIGKSGFPNYHMTFEQLALTNSSGAEIAGMRWKINEKV